MNGEGPGSWREQDQHANDIAAGVVRCNRCGGIAVPSKRSIRLRWCPCCKRVFKTPAAVVEKELQTGG